MKGHPTIHRFVTEMCPIQVLLHLINWPVILGNFEWKHLGRKISVAQCYTYLGNPVSWAVLLWATLLWATLVSAPLLCCSISYSQPLYFQPLYSQLVLLSATLPSDAIFSTTLLSATLLTGRTKVCISEFWQLNPLIRINARNDARIDIRKNRNSMPESIQNECRKFCWQACQNLLE